MGRSAETDRVGSPGAPPVSAPLRQPKWQPEDEVQLEWFKGAGDQWPPLMAVDPNQLDRYGVFVIWRNGTASSVSTVLYVGRGAIRQQLATVGIEPE